MLDLKAGAARAGELDVGRQDDRSLCLHAIARTERATSLPPSLLRAIGMVESGRYDPQSRIAAPWPWTINVEGTDHIFNTKAEAMQAVIAARAAGRQSIDVGCMQINLKHHPAAFASLQDAFDPDMNVSYAAAFLGRLHHDTGAWPAAAGAYHSFTPALANAYVARVAMYWPPAAGYQVPGYSAPPARPPLPNVDPYDVMTPEQRQRTVQAALDRAARDAAFTAPLEPAALPRSRSALMAAGRTVAVRPGQEASLNNAGTHRWR